MKIAIAGATGFVGQRLVERLMELGHTCVVLTRNAATAQRLFSLSAFPQIAIVSYGPTQAGDWQGAIAGCDGVVNLAGEPIAEKRWSPEQKQEILDSRVQATERIVEAIAQATPSPSVLVNASAIGYYGTSETELFTEASSSGQDFLAEVCRRWEAAAAAATAQGTRLVILRLGIVVGEGGAIGKMLPAFRAFAGGPIGTGEQWFSWIAREDVVNLIIKALTDSQMQGTYNATSPNPLRMKEVTEILGEVLGRPSWLPVPGFALELLLGEGATVVLQGQRVLPQRTQASGFEYQYPDLESALRTFI